MPKLINELFDLVSRTQLNVSKRSFHVDDEEIALLPFIEENIADVKATVFHGFPEQVITRIPELQKIRNGNGIFFDSAMRDNVIELLWQHFSFLIETGVDPHFYANKSPKDKVDIHHFLLRQMFLQRDVNIMSGQSLLPADIQSTLAHCVNVSCVFLYLYELGHVFYAHPALKAIVTTLFESIDYKCRDATNIDVVAAEYAAAIIMRNMTASPDTVSYAAVAYLSIIWTCCTPIVSKWVSFEEEGTDESFLRSLTSGTENFSLPIERLKAVLTIQKFALTRNIMPDQVTQWLLMASKGLASEGFLFESLNMHVTGEEIVVGASEYAHIFDELSVMIDALMGKAHQETLQPKGLSDEGKLHHYENPFYANLVRMAVREFLAKLNKVSKQVREMDILGSTIPLSDFNALVVPQQSKHWPTAIVMLQEGLCDVLWHTFSVVVQNIHAVRDESEVENYSTSKTKPDAAHLTGLQALLLAEPAAREALYKENVRSHTAAQKIFLSHALETAYCFIVGHEIAHILYADQGSRTFMTDYLLAHNIALPSGSTAEEEMCDIFSSLLILKSEETKAKRLYVQMALLWTASFFVIPEWLAWKKDERKDAFPSFESYLADQHDNIHPLGIRRFFTILKLFKSVMPEFKDDAFLLLSGSSVFTALGLEGRNILKDSGIVWPEEGSRHAVDLFDDPEHRGKSGSEWLKDDYSYHASHQHR